MVNVKVGFSIFPAYNFVCPYAPPDILTTPLPNFLTVQGSVVVLPIWAVTTLEFSVAKIAGCWADGVC